MLLGLIRCPISKLSVRYSSPTGKYKNKVDYHRCQITVNFKLCKKSDMLKAKQAVVAQNANQQLLGIRQNEIGYYSTYFGTFSVQATIIAGFTASRFYELCNSRVRFVTFISQHCTDNGNANRMRQRL